MTTALKKLITKLDKMPISEQNAIAMLLNEEYPEKVIDIHKTNFNHLLLKL